MKERNIYDAEYQRIYRNNNKELIKQKATQIFKCPRCNKDIQYANRGIHFKSKRCKTIYENFKKLYKKKLISL